MTLFRPKVTLNTYPVSEQCPLYSPNICSDLENKSSADLFEISQSHSNTMSRIYPDPV